ncbi:protein containing PAS domain S-box [Bellilinea caldifistulae]|uniref:GAF domain-containing protein n=1 Tax=Bellilinea caldifistulae TaxID=360411 RepID=UPI000782F06F|nr:GAF domain-containing protein [Bellilinea caldifistulae]GAP08949.1 protein containing PAS domain S-box [Bellilinea caldifistulae]
MGRVSSEYFSSNRVPLSELLTLYQELQEREALLRAILYSIGDAVITCDENGKITLLNPAAESLTGWSEAEARGKPLEDIFRIINEETRQPVESPVRRVLREGVVVGLANHTLLLRRDGSELPIADSGAPIRGEGGTIRGVVLIFRDQSAERAAQKAVDEARRFAEGIVETVREPLIVLDGDLRVVRANPAFYRLFQTTPIATENRLLYELGNGQWNIPELRRLLEDILPGNTRFENYEVRHDFPGIGRRTMLLNARRIYHEDNRTRFILLAIEDITERQQAVDTLNHSEARYRTISEMISDYAYAFEVLEDGSLKREWVAGGFERITGFTPEESEARGGWQALIYPPDMPVALCRAERLMSGRQDTSEFRIVRKDGSVRWLRDHGLPVWDEDQKRVVRIFGAAQDITDQKRRERELEAQALVVQILQEEGDLQSLLMRLLEAACHAIPAAEKGSVLLAESDGRLHMRAMIGYQDERVMTASFPMDSGYSARAFRLNQPLVIEDARAHAETRYDGEIAEMATVQSAIVAPLAVKGRAIGVLALDNCSLKFAFSDQDLQVLTTFAATAGLVIERTRLFEETQQRLKELQTLQQVSAALSQSDSVEDMTHIFVEHAVHSVDARAGSIYLLDEQTNELTARGWYNPRGEWIEGLERVFHQQLGEGVVGKVAASGEAYTFEDWRSDPHTVLKPGEEELLQPVRGGVALPLRAGARTIGVMNIWFERARMVTETERRLLAAIADMAGNALQRAHLNEQTHQRLAELSVLHSVSQALLLSGMEAEAVYEAIHQAVAQLMPCEAFTIVLVDAATSEYLAVYLYDKGGRFPPRRIPHGSGLSGRVIEQGRTLVIEDYPLSNLPAVHFGDPESVRSILAVPLRQGRRVLGMISAQSYQPAAYTSAHTRLLETLAAQFATTLENVRLFGETRQRLRELELIAHLSSELRRATTRAELLPVLLEQLMTRMKVDGAVLETVHPLSGDVTIELGVGIWESLTGEIIPAGQGLSAVILQSGKSYLNNDAHHDPRVYFPQQLGDCASIAGVPLRADDTINGLLWVGSCRRLDEDDLRLLHSVADMAASALLRLQLHEETRRRVEQLQALQAIDRVITSSLDLHFSLDALLEQTLLHLKMDAAGVLLFNPTTLMLEYAAGRGFRTRYYQKARLHLGESQAGMAALERRIVHCGDLSVAEPPFIHPQWVEEEGFVSYCGVPLVAKGQVKGVLEVFSRSPFEPQEEWLGFFEAISRQAAIAIENAQLFENLQRSNLDLSLAYEATIEGWSRALDLRDKETEGHTRRVADLTLLMAERIGLDPAQVAHVRRGALLHDIGKMGIPDAILLKPGPLTDEEWEIMRKHPLYAYQMLYPVQYLRPALDIPYCHHEKWDGTGYPRGLKGEEIPLAARIFAVADVWDALTSDRPYRPAWPQAKALNHIREQAGTHFDPRVVKVFFEVIEDFLATEAAAE